MRSPLLRILLLITSVAASACVTYVEEEARECPCAEGWTCCAGLCLKGGADVCPPPPPPDVTAPEAPRLDAARAPSFTREPAVVLHGRSEPRATVRLFAAEACAGEPVAEVHADASGAFSAQVTLAPNAPSRFTADARDASGNTSACTTPLDVTHDDVAPRPPELFGVAPASPSSSSTQPVLLGRAEPLARVVLFADAVCEVPLPFEGTADAAGAVQVWARVAPDSTTTFHARAVDAAGNVSGCAEAVAYTHDGTPPEAPVLTATAPASPGQALVPTWAGTTEPLARLRVHVDAGCGDTPIAQAQADETGAWSLALAVAPNGLTRRFATSMDAAGNRSACVELGAYVHDSLAPNPPRFVRFTPESPQNSTATPRVLLTAEPGATVIIRGYVVSTWQERELARGGVAPDGSVELVLSLEEGTTRLSASAVDAAGNASSPYGASAEYVYDITPPAAPVLQLLSEPSPSDSATGLWVVGRAELNARVSVHATPDCLGPELGAGTSTALAASGQTPPPPAFAVWAPVAQDADTHLFARAVDAAGNASACSAGLTFRHNPAGERLWHAFEPVPAGATTWLAMDATGRLYTTVESSVGGELRVEVLHRPAGAEGEAWQVHAVLATLPAGTRAGSSSPRLTGNARGDLLAAWYEPAADGGQVLRVARYTAALGQWEAPTTPPDASASGASVTLGQDGSALVCWTRWSQPSPSVYVFARSCSRAAAGEPWAPAQQLHDGNSELAERATGAGGALALRKLSESSPPYRTRLLGRVHTSESGWGPEVELSAWMRRYSVAVDAGGTAWLAYVAPDEAGGTGVWVRSLPPGAAAWSEPALLQGAVLSYPSLSLAVGGAGDVTVGWQDGEGRLVVRNHTATRGWSAVSEPLLPAEGTPSELRLVAGASGEAWGVWKVAVGPNLPDSSWYRQAEAVRVARYDRESGWDAPQTLSYEPAYLRASLDMVGTLPTSGTGQLAVPYWRTGSGWGLRVLR